MDKLKLQLKRKKRIRASLNTVNIHYCLIVDKSNQKLYGVVLDKKTNKILTSVAVAGKNKEAAIILGNKLAEFLKRENITQLVLDRSGYKYHGIVKQIADTVREGGVQI